MESEESRYSFMDKYRRETALEVKGQYTSAIISLLKEAVALRKDHLYWDALSHLVTTVAFVIKNSKEDWEALRGPGDLLREIERLANTIEGPTLEIRQATADLFRNEASRQYFDPTLEFIQDRLRSMGVYSAMGGNQRIDPNVIDLIPVDELDRY